jgi:hypothetical protein
MTTESKSVRLPARERTLWLAALMATAAVGSAATAWFIQGPQHASSHTLTGFAALHHAHSQTAHNSADLHTGCRQGAFVEAAGILNSVAEIAHQLPAGTPDRTRAELDTVLYTALRQAHSEVHCVAGGLRFGYDKAYAQTLDRVTDLARQRDLHPDVQRLGQETSAALRENRRLAANSAPH